GGGGVVGRPGGGGRGLGSPLPPPGNGGEAGGGKAPIGFPWKEIMIFVSSKTFMRLSPSPPPPCDGGGEERRSQRSLAALGMTAVDCRRQVSRSMSNQTTSLKPLYSTRRR